ncbi:hypothetical protein B0H17DRAFT_1137169 [Mycena rosella]|uniref:Uncharacterized protein n=1 Tax=Mycena rosella TaxID=1033263 RepID=A0AAD7D9J7_MYCRO|nr:hypothetical protein B0H17DRAFT_1137169 [Mycena rosella]
MPTAHVGEVPMGTIRSIYLSIPEGIRDWMQMLEHVHPLAVEIAQSPQLESQQILHDESYEPYRYWDEEPDPVSNAECSCFHHLVARVDPQSPLHLKKLVLRNNVVYLDEHNRSHLKALHSLTMELRCRALTTLNMAINHSSDDGDFGENDSDDEDNEETSQPTRIDTTAAKKRMSFSLYLGESGGFSTGAAYGWEKGRDLSASFEEIHKALAKNNLVIFPAPKVESSRHSDILSKQVKLIPNTGTSH